MEGIKIYKKPKLKNPYFIVAWPGMGEVAFKAAKYLVEKLKAEEFASVLPKDDFYLTSNVIKDGVLDLPQLPQGTFYYWKNPVKKDPEAQEKNDLVIFISNAQPDLSKTEQYCERVLSFVKGLKVRMVISFAAMPQPIEHTQVSNIWLAATSRDLINRLKRHNIKILSEGQISGMNGLFLGKAKKFGLQGFTLLCEIPLYTIQIENPKATHAVLEALLKILNMRMDLNGLLEQAQAMEEEINKLLDYLKIGTPLGPIEEEEVENIKNTLSQLAKLPLSVKTRIEHLFTQTKEDISKANELKSELDKWNVYKDYEDRFLDLFRKKESDSV